MALSYEGLLSVQAFLGTGALVVVNQSVGLEKIIAVFMKFERMERS
jgi:NADH:ubiquinone oxidoreductase subunit F (NADH-binding)